MLGRIKVIKCGNLDISSGNYRVLLTAPNWARYPDRPILARHAGSRRPHQPSGTRPTRRSRPSWSTCRRACSGHGLYYVISGHADVAEPPPRRPLDPLKGGKPDHAGNPDTHRFIVGAPRYSLIRPSCDACRRRSKRHKAVGTSLDHAL
jgi:hypothetical protein